MKLFMALWSLLNGKKMNISSIALIISLILRQQGIIDVSSDDIAANWDLIAAGGAWFIGLAHKVKKYFDEKKAVKK